MMIPFLFALALTPTGQCHEIRYHADGSVSERMVDADSGSTSASSHATGTNRARSSVSLSSHSGGGSRSQSSAASDGTDRSVSITHGPDGCTIVIDERDSSDRSLQ